MQRLSVLFTIVILLAGARPLFSQLSPMGFGMQCSANFSPNKNLPYKTLFSIGINSMYGNYASPLIYGWSLAISFPEMRDSIGKPQNDYACPHSDYYISGEYKSGLLLSADFETGYLFSKNDNDSFYVVGEIGASAGYIANEYVGVSNATGWTYNQGSAGTDSLIMIDVGIRLLYYYDKMMGISIGYNIERGIIFMITF